MLCSGFTGSLDPNPDQVAFRLPAAEGAVRDARHRVRAALCDWDADLCCDDMTLVVSELFTNAVRHTESEWIDVTLWSDSGLLYVEVTDQGRTTDDVVVRDAVADDECGRGLMLVQHLALGWGAGRSRHGIGHRVWAALRDPGSATRAVPTGRPARATSTPRSLQRRDFS